MRSKSIFLLISLLILLSSNGYCGGEAMFGLSWGDTPEKLKRMKVDLKHQEKDRNLDIYKCTSLPKNLSDTEGYLLIFTQELGLVKIVMIGRNIENDPYGTNGKERFEALSKILSEKYIKNSDLSMTVSGLKLWDERDEFYQCLAYSGCGYWVNSFNADNKVIGLELNGIRRGVGFIRVVSEAVPEFSQALDTYNSIKNNSETNAL